ncbi:MAG TPA: anthranilate synthase component I family protein [Holophagaceae bacterium]|nr:anthranilate synthase component I family protein [Holophagaceae bacterium]
MELPRPWPAAAQGWLRAGATWLHSGIVRPGDPGGDLLALPAPEILETRWDGRQWTSTWQGAPLPLPPWEALDWASKQGLPLVGALTYELACFEAGHAHQPPALGSLGQRWHGVRHAVRVQARQAELWSWVPDPDLAALLMPFQSACALKRPAFGLEPRWDQARHARAVEEAQRLIHDGGFYVANLCVPFEGAFCGDPVTLALAAFKRAQPPYGAYLPWGSPSLLCLSMERLLARRGDRLWTEPIKGSVALDTPAGQLAADPKERAEHTMIVDLQRNDLGRVSRAGSVKVSQLMVEEDFPTVRHLVSRVESLAKPALELPELLRALLPGGSITGAPKHAVCDWLARVEASPRGFYCGALGWILPDGDLDLAMPIRTAQLEQDRITYWAGGGITRRSIVAREWAELHLKIRAMTQALSTSDSVNLEARG